MCNASGMTIAEAYEPFSTYARAELNYADQTLVKLRDCFVAWILPQVGHTELDQLDLLNILALRDAMLNRKMSIARQYSILNVLKRFLRFSREVLRVNALDPAEIKLPKRPKPKPEALTNEELDRIFESIDTRKITGVRLRALIELLAATGLRIGEALALNRKPFDLGYTEVEITGKGDKLRTVFPTQRCIFWVRQYMARRTDQDQALFVTTGGSPRRWAQVDVSPYFIRLRKEAKIDKRLTPHLLRHTFCTNLLNNGADITYIKDLAGHADIQTTARYYLKVDTVALKRVVHKYLNYESRRPERAVA